MIHVYDSGRLVAACLTDESAAAVRRLCEMTRPKPCCPMADPACGMVMLADLCDEHFLGRVRERPREWPALDPELLERAARLMRADGGTHG